MAVDENRRVGTVELGYSRRLAFPFDEEMNLLPGAVDAFELLAEIDGVTAPETDPLLPFTDDGSQWVHLPSEEPIDAPEPPEAEANPDNQPNPSTDEFRVDEELR